MKKRASEALNSSDLLTFRSLEEEEEGFIGVDDDGRLILKSKVKEENDFAFAIVPRGCIDSSGEVISDTHTIPLIYGQPLRFYHQRTVQFVAPEVDSYQDGDDSLVLHLEKVPGPAGVFRIFPVAGTALEGDKICEGDKIRIEHEASGFILHLSESVQSGVPIIDLRYGIDKSSVIPWTIGRAGENRMVFGNQVRLCHSEVGFLHSSKQGQSLVAKKPINEEDARPSYKSLWVVEPDEPTQHLIDAQNEPLCVTINHAFYLRQFGTDNYLKVETAKPEPVSITTSTDSLSGKTISDGLSDPKYAIKLSPKKMDNGLFRFHPVNPQTTGNEDEKIVKIGEPMLLECITHKVYFHIGDSGAYNTGNKNAQTDVGCIDKVKMKDALSAMSVPPSMLLDYARVLEIRRVLEEYTTQIKKDSKPEVMKKLRKAVSEALSNAIIFCSRDDMADPFKREGTPIPHRQSLLFQNLLHVLVDIVDIGPNQHTKITTLALKALKLIVRGSFKNSRRLHKLLQLPDFSGKKFPKDKAIKYYSRIPVALTFIEMYQSSSDLCYDLTQLTVDSYFDLIEESGDAQYFTLLSSLCMFQGAIVHSNQTMIAQTLFRRASAIVLLVESKSNALQVISRSFGRVNLVDFTLHPKFKPPEREYLLELLRLYSAVSVGQNITAGKLLKTKEVGNEWATAYNALSSVDLPPIFRAASCEVLLHLFLEVDSHLDPTQTELKKIWHIRREVKEGELDKAGCGYEIDPDPSTFPPTVAIKNNPQTLSEFLVNYIHQPHNTRFDAVELSTNQPELLAKVFELSRQAFYFGDILKRQEPLLMRRFKEILSIKEGFTHTGEPRTLEEEHIKILNKVKMECLLMVDRYIDIVVADRFHKFLVSWKQETANASQLDRLLIHERSTKEAIAEKLMEDYRKTGAPMTTKTFDMKASPPLGRCTDGFIPVLLQLLESNDRELNSMGLKVLKRMMMLQNYECTILKQLASVQIITNPELLKSYQTIVGEAGVSGDAKEIWRLFLQADAKQDRINWLLQRLQMFTSLCMKDLTKNDTSITHQRLFRNLNIQETIMNLVKRPIDIHPSVDPEETAKVLTEAYNFLAAFVKNNPKNQVLVHKHQDFIIHQMLTYKPGSQVSLAIADTIIHILQGNHALAEQLGRNERLIQPFIRLALGMSKHPIYPQVLMTIVDPAGTLIKNNQNIILRLLLSHPNAKNIFPHGPRPDGFSGGFKSPKPGGMSPIEIRAEANSAKLIAKPSFSPLTAQCSFDNLNRAMDKRLKDEAYWTGVINLVANCAGGRNNVTESQCQKLLSLDDCINMCYSVRESSPRLFFAHLLFADEVYLNTESLSLQAQPQHVNYVRNFWPLMEALETILRKFMRNKLPADLTDEIFTVAVTFVGHFYKLAYDQSKASEASYSIGNKLIDAIFDLREEFKKNKRYNYITLTTIQAMFSQGLAGVEREGNLEKLMHSSVASGLNENDMIIDNKAIEQRAHMEEIRDLRSKQFLRIRSREIYQAIVRDYFFTELIAKQTKRARFQKQKQEQKELQESPEIEGEEDEEDEDDEVVLDTSRRHWLENKKGSKRQRDTIEVAPPLTPEKEKADKTAKKEKKGKKGKGKGAKGKKGKNGEKGKDKDRLERSKSVASLGKSVKKVGSLATGEDADFGVPGSSVTGSGAHGMEPVAPADLLKLTMTHVTDWIGGIHNDDTLVIKDLKLLREFVLFKGVELVPARIKHKKLLSLAVPITMASLIGCRNQKVIELALEIFVLILESSAKDTKRHAEITMQVTDWLTGKDKFFQDVVHHINSFKQEIKDHKQNSTQPTQKLVTHNFTPPPELYLPPRVNHVFKALQLLAAEPMFKKFIISDTVDIVRETVQFLKLFQSEISRNNFNVAIQLFDTLSEFVGGHPLNQRSAIKAQILTPINAILRNDFNPGDLQGEDIGLKGRMIDLKVSITNCLLALTDGAQEEMFEDIMSQVKPDAFQQTLKFLDTDVGLPPLPGGMTLASNSFQLLSSLVDRNQNNKEYAAALRNCENLCRSHIGRIEVFGKANDVEIIYFPIPQDFRPSSQRTHPTFLQNLILQAFSIDLQDKEDLNANLEKSLTENLDAMLHTSRISWERAGDKIENFVDYAHKVLLQREYDQEKAKTKYEVVHEEEDVPGPSHGPCSSCSPHRLLRYCKTLRFRFADTFMMWWNISFLIAIVINVLLLQAWTMFERDQTLVDAIEGLGIAQTIITILMFLAFVLQYGTYMNRVGWIRALGKDGPCLMLEPWREVRESVLRRKIPFRMKPFYWTLSMLQVMYYNPQLVFHTAYLACSILGNFNPLFFCFHLLQILLRSPQLMFISRAFSANAWPIFLVFFLMLDTVYIMSIFSFVFFQEQYTEISSCESLGECLLSNIYYGIPSAGGIFEFIGKGIEVDQWSQTIAPDEISMFWVLYVILFFAVIGVIQLNVIFAIVVDTFSNLRQRRQAAKHNLQGSCFICSLGRDDFQKKGKDFNKHQDNEHNKLHYLYYFAYLQDKVHAGLPLTPMEDMVIKKLRGRQFLKFFPIGHAYSLREGDNELTSFQKFITNKGELFHARLNISEIQQDRMRQTTAESLRMTVQLVSDISQMKTELDAIVTDMQKMKKGGHHGHGGSLPSSSSSSDDDTDRTDGPGSSSSESSSSEEVVDDSDDDFATRTRRLTDDKGKSPEPEYSSDSYDYSPYRKRRAVSSRSLSDSEEARKGEAKQNLMSRRRDKRLRKPVEKQLEETSIKILGPDSPLVKSSPPSSPESASDSGSSTTSSGLRLLESDDSSSDSPDKESFSSSDS